MGTEYQYGLFEMTFDQGSPFFYNSMYGPPLIIHWLILGVLFQIFIFRSCGLVHAYLEIEASARRRIQSGMSLSLTVRFSRSVDLVPSNFIFLHRHHD